MIVEWCGDHTLVDAVAFRAVGIDPLLTAGRENSVLCRRCRKRSTWNLAGFCDVHYELPALVTREVEPQMSSPRVVSGEGGCPLHPSGGDTKSRDEFLAGLEQIRGELRTLPNDTYSEMVTDRYLAYIADELDKLGALIEDQATYQAWQNIARSEHDTIASLLATVAAAHSAGTRA